MNGIQWNMTTSDLLRALRIADEAAVSDIEMGAHPVYLDGVRWYDIRPMIDEREHSPEVIDLAAVALDHALMRRLAQRHDVHTHLVRVMPRGDLTR